MTQASRIETDMLALGKPFGDEGDAARAAAADKAMENLSGVLDEPEFTGDIQTALIHHMRRDAFDWFLSDHMVADHVAFAEKIAKTAEKSDDPVPVVMSYQVINGGGTPGNGGPNFETALVAFDGSEPQFHSAVDHKRDIREPGFASPLAVTTRALSLIGNTVRLQGLDLAGHMGHYEEDQETALDRTLGGFKTRDELVLHKTKLTSGRNSVDPPRFHGVDGTSEETDLFYSSQRPLIGWEEVIPAVSGGILDIGEDRDSIIDGTGNGKTLRYANQIRGLFDEVGQLDALLERSGRELKAVLGEAAAFTEALSELAFKERPPQRDTYWD